jgi:SAM-dependent methyltransferase
MECEACHTQYWFPVEHAGKHFYETSETYNIVKRNPAWYHRQFLNHPPLAQGRLLDVGCGQGEFLTAAKEKGFDVYGIDIAPRNIEFIKTRRDIQTVVCGKIEDNIEALGKFDVVTLFEVLEHVESPATLLESIKKLLNPGGYFIMSTPNRKRFGGASESWDFPPNHLFRWDGASLSMLIERAGYRVEKIKEQVVGRDYIIMSGISSLGIVSKLRSAPKITNNSSSEASPRTSEGQGKKLRVVKKIANLKNAILLIITSPFVLIGKMIGLKYWDLYVVSRID